MSCDEFFDADDAVDPRVQVELERLNAATDEINRLEVELDDCRNQFRHLLAESTSRIEAFSKKLGPCIDIARPYYDARLKVKEALRETQKVASKYERANSALAAAKEMVFLAEEGLKTEGRTFDHAWQEMLNHATMRVNESEAERTLCETEHKQSSQLYQTAEHRVHTLQHQLKRAITKSRPYFEMRIHCNLLLEEQKRKVKALEKQIADTKLSYSDTLRNLEQISDEIHQTRQYHKSKRQQKTGNDSNESGVDDNKESIELAFDEASLHFRCDEAKENVGASVEDSTVGKGLMGMTPTSVSSLPDTDVWSEISEIPANEAIVSPETDSSLTGLPDTDSEDDVLKPAESIRGSILRAGFTKLSNQCGLEENNKSLPYSDGVGICSFPVESDINIPFNRTKEENEFRWTEISLCSPRDKTFATVYKNQGLTHDDYNIPYAPLPEVEIDQGGNANITPHTPTPSQSELESTLAAGLSNANSEKKGGTDENLVTENPFRRGNQRRQSLDILFSSATGEKMKEILSQSILKLNIGTLHERRRSDFRENEGVSENRVLDATQTPSSAYEAKLSSQFGLQFFSKKTKVEQEAKPIESQESLSNQLGGLLSRKENFFARKVHNPLERTLSFLNADEDSTSDTDSLSSVDMLTDEQLSALLLDQDFSELYQDILQ